MVCKKDSIIGGKSSIFDAHKNSSTPVEEIFRESCELLNAQIKDNIALNNRLMTMIEELERRLELNDRDFLQIIPVNRELLTKASSDYSAQSDRMMTELNSLIRKLPKSGGSSVRMQQHGIYALISDLRKQCDSYEDKAGYWLREVQMVVRATRDRQSIQACIDRVNGYMQENGGKVDEATAAEHDFMDRMSRLRDICQRLLEKDNS